MAACNFLLLDCMLLLARMELFSPYTPYAGTPFGLILYPVAIYQDLPTTEFVFLKVVLNFESHFSMCQVSEFIKALRKKNR